MSELIVLRIANPVLFEAAIRIPCLENEVATVIQFVREVALYILCPYEYCEQNRVKI
jgi:hypothetical protein